MKIPSLKSRKTVFLAVGNIMRADDAFGPLVYGHLKSCKSQNFMPLDGAEMPENFAAKITSFAPDFLIIADASALNAPAGTLQIIDEADIINPAMSTHSLPLDIMIKFLKKDLPQLQIIFITAAAQYTDFDCPPSQKITAAAKETAAAIIAKL